MTEISMKLLKAALNSPDLPTLMTGQQTHDAALKFSGALVHAGADDERIGAIFGAALPHDYAGNTLSELPAMIAGARERGFASESETPVDRHGPHDNRGRKDPAQVALDATSDLVELFRDDRGKSYLSIGTEAGGRLCHEIESEPGRDIVQKVYYDASGGRALPEQKLKDVIRTLKARAKHGGIERSVHRRVARHGANVYIDLGTPTGEVVKITSQDYAVVTECPVAFVRSATMKPLPHPKPGGSLKRLADILQLCENSRPLFFGFLLNCLRGVGPYFCLLVEGPQGSGKSFLCGTIKNLIDPDDADRLRLPSDEQELMLQAMNFFLPVYDNASGMPGKISDTLCSIATGGALVNRTLYTNDQVSVLRAQRPFVINGIGDVVSRPDLLERAILLELNPLDQYGVEADLARELELARPEILGALYKAVALALKQEGQTAVPDQVRMVDAARWITAAEPAMKVSSGSFVQALTAQQTEVAVERVSNEPIVGPLQSLLDAGRPFEGTMKELHRELCEGRYHSAAMPQGPGPLSKKLKRLAPQLKTIGIHVEIGRTKMGSRVRIWREPEPITPDNALFPSQEAADAPLTFKEKMARRGFVRVG